MRKAKNKRRKVCALSKKNCEINLLKKEISRLDSIIVKFMVENEKLRAANYALVKNAWISCIR